MDSNFPSARPSRRSLAGPLFVLTLGLVLLVDHVIPDWGIGKTWPVLLIAIGVAKLIQVTQPPRPPRGPQV